VYILKITYAIPPKSNVPPTPPTSPAMIFFDASDTVLDSDKFPFANPGLDVLVDVGDVVDVFCTDEPELSVVGYIIVACDCVANVVVVGDEVITLSSTIVDEDVSIVDVGSVVDGIDDETVDDIIFDVIIVEEICIVVGLEEEEEEVTGLVDGAVVVDIIVLFPVEVVFELGETVPEPAVTVGVDPVPTFVEESLIPTPSPPAPKETFKSTGPGNFTCLL